MDETINAIDDKTECLIELQKAKRILYFGDGTMEELSDSSDGEDLAKDKSMDVNIDLTTLPFMPRVRYQAYQLGSLILSGIDYVGEGFASFFGITTPKHISESEIENAYNKQNEIYESEASGTWQQNNFTKNTVITSYPRNSVNNST